MIQMTNSLSTLNKNIKTNKNNKNKLAPSGPFNSVGEECESDYNLFCQNLGVSPSIVLEDLKQMNNDVREAHKQEKGTIRKLCNQQIHRARKQRDDEKRGFDKPRTSNSKVCKDVKRHQTKIKDKVRCRPPTHGGPPTYLDKEDRYHPEVGFSPYYPCPYVELESKSDDDVSDMEPVEPGPPAVPGPWEQIRTNAQNVLGNTLARDVINHLERLILFAYKLSADQTFEQAIASCAMYLKYYVQGSVLVTIFDYIRNFCAGDLADGVDMSISDKFSAEAAGEESSPASSGLAIVWEGLKTAKFAKKIVYIIGTVSAVAACKISNVKLNHSLIDVFMRAKAAEEIEAFDLLDAIVSTYHWVSTVGLACLRERSLKPMQLSTSQLYKIQARYIHWYNLRSTIFSPVKTAETEALRSAMFEELKSMIEDCHKILKYKTCGTTAVLANTVVKPIIDFYENCRKIDANVDFVEASQGYLIYGPPGTGKSSIVPHICTCVAVGLGRKYNPKYAATINLADKYQDKLTNETETIHIDEIAPTKQEFNTTINSAVATSLALVSNTPFQPVRSDLDNKSSIVCRHYCTTMCANEEEPLKNLMSEPGAYFRRYVNILMTVKPEYQNHRGALDTDNPMFKVDDYPDVWDFDVYELYYEDGVKYRKYLRFNWHGVSIVANGINIRQLEHLIVSRAITHGEKEREKYKKNMEKGTQKHCLKCHTMRGCVCDQQTVRTETPPAPSGASTVSFRPPEPMELTSVVSGHVAPPPPWLRTQPVRPPPVVFAGFGQAPFQPESLLTTVANAVVRASFASVNRWLAPLDWFNNILRVDEKVSGIMDHELLTEINNVTDWMMAGAIALVPERVSSHRFFRYFKDKLMWAVAAQDQKLIPPGVLLQKSLLCGLITGLANYAFTVCNPRFAPASLIVGSVYACSTLIERPHRVQKKQDDVVEKMFKYLSFSACSAAKEEMPPFDGEYFIIGSTFTMPPTRSAPRFSETFAAVDKAARSVVAHVPSIQPGLSKIADFAVQIPGSSLFNRAIPFAAQSLYQCLKSPVATSVMIGSLTSMAVYGALSYRAWLGAPRRYQMLQDKIDRSPVLQRQLWERARASCEEYNTGIVHAAGVAGVILTGLVMWNTWRKREPEMQDGEDRKSGWFTTFNLFKSTPPVASVEMNRSNSQVINALKNNVITVYREDGKGCCRATGIRPNVCVMPLHFFHEDSDYNKPLRKCSKIRLQWNSKSGIQGVSSLYPDSIVPIPNRDLCLVYLSKASTFADVRGMLPKVMADGHVPANLVLKMDGVHVEESVCAGYLQTADTMLGDVKDVYKYSSSHTSPGHCGSPLVADRRDGAILGFHIAGRDEAFSLVTNKREGIAQSLLRGDYDFCEKILFQQNPNTPLATPTSVPTSIMGQTVYAPGSAHPHAAVFHDGRVGSTGNVEVLGQCPLRATAKSEIKPSLLKDAVNECFGVQTEYGPPKFKPEWAQFNRAIEAIELGADDVDPHVLRLAVEDYIAPLEKQAEQWKLKHPGWCKPLSVDESINGVYERPHIKPIEMKTSIGLPKLGRKDSVFIPVPHEDKTRPKQWEMPPDVQVEYDRIMSHYSKGERANVFAHACFKDEAVKLTKDKVRLIYVQQAAFTIVLRQFYLPVLEFLLHHPKTAECAVGINCAGPDWDDLMTYLERFAKDGLGFGLDYENYDLKRAVNVTNASMTIMIRLARILGYDPQSLSIMEALLADLTNPNISWNGTMVRVWMWISGNSLTVHGNSMDNSLLVRCCYFTELMKHNITLPGNFRDNVALGTYGDDLKSSVHERARRVISFTIYRDYLATIGMKITTPNKEETELGFWPLDDLDFLKRKSVFIPELGCRVGAIDEASIFRQLQYCSCPDEPGARQDDAVASIGDAIREWFLHGREIYESRRETLKQVCEMARVYDKNLERDFDELVQQWKENNLPANS
jgi:hypothetical protein